jgi:diguanylate cyclase (GGDEF)-like protein
MPLPNPKSSAYKPRILVIDDSADAIKLTTAMIGPSASVSFAINGERGLALAQALRPELILLDMGLPDTDGLTVCRILKESPDTSDIPVLFVTAKDDEESEIAALEAGAVDYLVKPLRPGIAKARINAHLSLRRHQLLLMQMVHQDGLTGIYNRRYFDERLAAEYAVHRPRQAPLAVAMIDIDCFKSYNDALGHVSGDVCLKAVAETLEGAARRPSEIVARYGGEEFAILLPDTPVSELAHIGNWFLQCVRALRMAHPASPVSGAVSVSIGLASTIPSKKTSPQSLIEAADGALYQAKTSGRNASIVATCS